MTALGAKEMQLRALRESRQDKPRAPVTKIRELASRKPGRPRKPNALSPSERQRLRRARLKAKA